MLYFQLNCIFKTIFDIFCPEFPCLRPGASAVMLLEVPLENVFTKETGWSIKIGKC